MFGIIFKLFILSSDKEWIQNTFYSKQTYSRFMNWSFEALNGSNKQKTGKPSWAIPSAFVLLYGNSPLTNKPCHSLPKYAFACFKDNLIFHWGFSLWFSLRIWNANPKKSLMENFIFCEVVLQNKR